MQNAIWKIIRLMAGLFLYSLGIAFTVNARLGLAPWDVFHQGLSNQLGISMGVAIQIAGAAVLILDLLLHERIGWGTIANVYFIGLFLDLIQHFGLVPLFQGLIPGVLMMVIGMIIISFATYLYLGAELGSGPRDGLMVALTKALKLPVGLIRGGIELTVCIAGYLMGGSIGWGTLIMALGMGVFIQVIFGLLKFDLREIQHHTIDQDIAAMLKNKADS
jgi:uncharacterized membrane protein YczE